ncbi:hypothetical protein DFH09DRAFT_1084560 [Mycena vulgaris]|nr:hypothetical protein DFH09DRAFT_1084560 [Mycena vulgaris]
MHRGDRRRRRLPCIAGEVFGGRSVGRLASDLGVKGGEGRRCEYERRMANSGREMNSGGTNGERRTANGGRGWRGWANDNEDSGRLRQGWRMADRVEISHTVSEAWHGRGQHRAIPLQLGTQRPALRAHAGSGVLRRGLAGPRSSISQRRVMESKWTGGATDDRVVSESSLREAPRSEDEPGFSDSESQPN